jgi:DNA polymerase-3 subunit gamma/tau
VASLPYSALYRKLRPTTFDEIVGQRAIVRTLKNQILSGRVSHAYLFCGTRGTGKTSAAKVFARAINCESPADGNPCNACRACKAALADASPNVIEMDAASNNGVDDVRGIREETRYAPAEGRHKVYIIDEAHMMTASAFNALLKTLEEPPPFVTFILATTDPQKLPPTILSRVQRFNFARVPLSDMASAISGYMRGEGIDITEDALSYVCSISDGAMRDALSTLDQCAAYYRGETITLEKLLEAIGAADDAAFFTIADALFDKKPDSALSAIAGAAADGRDMARFAADLTAHFRNLLVSSVSKGEGAGIEVGYSAGCRSRLNEQAGKLGADFITRALTQISETAAGIKRALSPRLALEVLCVILCRPGEDARAEPPAKTPRSHGAAKTEVKPALKKSVPEDVLTVREGWARFAETLSTPAREYALSAEIRSLGDGRLCVVCENIAALERLKKIEPSLKERLNAAFSRDFDVLTLSRTRFEAQHKAQFGQDDSFDYDARIKEVLGGGAEVELS